jgi:ADP-heptose:LPS heptosyltransferase
MIKKVLFFRHDKIGDFVLSWPALYLLKTALPQASIEVFVSPILKTFAQACPYIDRVIIDSGDDKAIRAEIAARNYDVALVSLSQFRIYKIIRHLKIPYVLAPQHNWYQYLYKNRADAQYKKGEPCWRGGCMLVEHFLTEHKISIPQQPKRYWNVEDEREKWQDYYGRQAQQKLIFVHPGTGGSSGSLSPQHFGHLLTRIQSLTKHQCKFVLTYNGTEEVLAEAIFTILNERQIDVVMAKPLRDLTDFAKSIVAADLFIAGSTGPLHIAGLHDVPTVGFYAGRRSEPKVRWQTLTQSHKRLAFTPPVGKKTGRNMALIDFEDASEKIAGFLDSHYE